MAPCPRQEDEVATNTSPSSSNPENGSSNNDNDDPNNRSRLEDLGYGVSSFYTILQPVFVTMFLSAVAVIFLTTEESKAETTEALTNSYTVLQNDDENHSGARMVGQSLVNALVIVSVICVVTFIIVLLYKYRCMKCLIGYMLVAMVLLLGTLSARIWYISVERYSYPIDKITFAIVIYNFSVVGTYSIFLAQGVPKYITQSYLILTSVFVAWEFSHFDEYTGWALLVMLALYDLYAVLTPYGPLQALVKLMQSPNAPPVPGLLYEANVTGSNTRQSRPPPTSSTNASTTNARDRSDSPETDQETMTDASDEVENTVSQIQSSQESEMAPVGSSFATFEQTEHEPPSTRVEEANKNQSKKDTNSSRTSGPVDVDAVTDAENQQFTEGRRKRFRFDDSHPRISIPMALAKLYRLPLEDNPNPTWLQRSTARSNETEATAATPNYSVEELTAIVVAVAPPNGGVIRPHPEQVDGKETRYQVFDATGQARRILFVDSTNGRVFEVHNYEEALEAHKISSSKRESIRLGLGDFIFYSVLVSKAALYSWATFCASSLVILCGLGLTLLLLAWHGKALPALPISIFLGVTFYLSTRYLLQPWIEELFQNPIYV